MARQNDINQLIYQFTDYREFLKTYYDQKKALRQGFSYRAFAAMAEFTSPSFIRLVINGQKNLTKISVVKLCRAMELDTNAADYFENLVFFSQARSFEDKKVFLNKIDQFHKKNTPSIIAGDEFDYLKQWYHPVIRELADTLNSGGTPESISGKLLFPVTPAQVKASLNFLTTHGFIERDAQGIIHKKDKTLSTGKIQDNELLKVTARAFHKTMAHISADSISLLPGSERNTTDTTLGLSLKGLLVARERIKALRFELLELAASEESAERVYQLHINLFPLTQGLND